MTGSPSAVISIGLGAWGNPSLLLTLGLGSGEASTALIGPWTPIHCKSSNARLTAQSANTRIPCVSSNKRIET
jgi:hypothetical protein